MTSLSNPVVEAVTLLAVMRKVGLHVRLEAGQLRVGPARLMEPYDVAYIKEHRAGIVALLAAESAPTVESTTVMPPQPSACILSKIWPLPARPAVRVSTSFPIPSTQPKG
ncbi:hypothetical protein [Acidithiobacillus sp.]|uniref:hypothetical protein n=1 Tax=Acidithiobacillus sp. TaxID=1872118 RepID=UPI0035692945